MPAETILIIDDDIAQLRMQEHALHRLHYQTLTAGGNEQAVMRLLAMKKLHIGLVLLDLDTLGAAGIDLIRAIKTARPELPIVMLTSYGENEYTAKALQAGAHDFLAKPVMFERLRLSLQQAMRLHRMHNYIAWLERQIAGHVDFSDIVGHNPAIKAALDLAKEASASKMPVWIEGEVGTGKELAARAIHGSSDRAGKPFVVVHCQALPEHLAEAILFGQDKTIEPSNVHFVLGKLREADQGTLLLKEVDALKPELQQKLLAMLEYESIAPVGSSSRIKSDVRVMCTTDKPGEYFSIMGAESRLARLQQFVVKLPSLQARKDDIAILAEHFLTVYAVSENKYIQGISERALQWLINCSWPGNVSQLANTIWRAVMLCDNTQLDIGDLQRVQKSKSDASLEMTAAAGAALIDEAGKVRTLKSVEEEAIRFALHHANGCMTRAARNLGIGRSTLYRKVNELELSGYISRANHTTRPMMTASSGNRS